MSLARRSCAPVKLTLFSFLRLPSNLYDLEDQPAPAQASSLCHSTPINGLKMSILLSVPVMPLVVNLLGNCMARPASLLLPQVPTVAAGHTQLM